MFMRDRYLFPETWQKCPLNVLEEVLGTLEEAQDKLLTLEHLKFHLGVALKVLAK